MQTRQLSLLAVMAASGALVLSACVQLPPMVVVSPQGFTAPAQPQGAVRIGEIGRSGGYRVGPITAHPTKPVCSQSWYIRGFQAGYSEHWDTSVSDAAFDFHIHHPQHTSANTRKMNRLVAMTILDKVYPPVPSSFYTTDACGVASQAQGRNDGGDAADQAWYPIHQKLMREHILTY